MAGDAKEGKPDREAVDDDKKDLDNDDAVDEAPEELLR